METDRIILRPWRDSDAETLYKWASDPDVGPRAGWAPHKSVEESLEIIRTVFNDALHTWAIELKETGEAIGAMGYGPSCECDLPAREGEPLIGYWVAKPYWNKGICTEALRLMLDHIRESTDIKSLISGHFIDNPASGRVMEKCGFVPTGETCIDANQYQGEGRPIRVLRLKINKESMEQRFCQSCGMPLTEEVLGTNADGSKNEDYCMYCYKDGKFLQDCTMEEMIEHCAQFVNEVNKGLPQPITKEEYIGQMKMYFPHLKRWRKSLALNNDEAMPDNPALAGVKELIATMADTLPVTYISSVDEDGFPCTKAMLSPRVREGIKKFYFTTNTFSLRVAHYKANPKASIYFCDAEGFKGMMLRGTMEVLTDAKSKEMIWHKGDEQYYPGGVTDPNYCVLKFTATDGRFYSDFYPRSFVIE
jgi:RimJ/RimL family protein N-acetyltransferase/general stress protein 26